MTRPKVSLSYISNDAARKTTFKKRKRGIVKKVSELTTLCGIEACAIVYNPYESQPEVWPDQKAAEHVIARYQKAPLVDERKNLNQESFFRQGIIKVTDQLNKQLKENREKDMTITMLHCIEGEKLDNKTMEDLNDIDFVIKKNIKEVNKKIDELI